MANTITLDLDDQEQLDKLRELLGLEKKKQPRIAPAMKQVWAHGKDGRGEWILAIDSDDFRDQPIPYPIPRIVEIPDIYADGMDQFSAYNNDTKKSVYESKPYLPVPKLGEVTCPTSEYVRLMDRYNGERQRSKKPGLKIDPAAIPGPWGTKPAPAKKESASGRA